MKFSVFTMKGEPGQPGAQGSAGPKGSKGIAGKVVLLHDNTKKERYRILQIENENKYILLYTLY